MVSPGFSTSSCFSDACCTPVPAIQTSPEDLLTAQAPSSAANALDAVDQRERGREAREKFAENCTHETLRLPLFDPRGYGNVSRLSERELPGFAGALTIH